jgi:hypothetical protein
MSSQSIVPTADQMTDPNYGASPAPSDYVSQSSQNPAPEVSDPGPVNGPSRLNSVLARIVGVPTPVNNAQPSASSGGSNEDSDPNFDPSSGQRSGGFKNALGTGLQVLSTALAGTPPGKRPSFLGGLGNGARAEDQALAQQQAIKFQSFQDQVRAADLHNQDLQKQAADDAQQKAQQAAEDFQREAYEGNGGTYNTHPNNGTAVTQTLQAQTAANGAATVTPGTHISANGKDILVPGNDPNSLAAQVQNYKALQGVLPGLPTLPEYDPSSAKSMSDIIKARNALGTQLHIMSNLVQGYDISGRALTHQELNNLIPAYQSQIDSLQKNGRATDYQLGTLKNTLAILQANEQHHSDTEDAVAAKATANAAAKAGAVANAELPAKEAEQKNASVLKAANAKIDNTSVVAFDPDAPGLNGSKGANVVLPKAQADAKGLASYKANPEKINGIIAGVNDVQTKINALADASADMSEVDPSVSATMSGNGIGLEWHGVGLGSLADIANSQGRVLANKGMNDATRNYIVALAGAHEAITQLPRLQTMGASSRVTEAQMQQAAKMLPTPGDNSDMANAKLIGLQNTIDPIRKQIPQMPGASMVPSFRENGGSNWSRAQRLQQSSAGKTPTQAGSNTGTFDYSSTM